jgi:hypothetical protein
MSDEQEDPEVTEAPEVANGEIEPDEYTFSLVRKQKVINLDDGNGTVRKYVMRELKGSERDRYSKLIASRAKGGTIGDTTNLMAELISRSLYDDANKNVAVALVAEWPSSTQISLFRIATKLSGLNQDLATSEKETKNA